MREYFDEDLARLSAEYERFVRELTRRGNGERIWRGESPFQPAAAVTPSAAPAPAASAPVQPASATVQPASAPAPR